MGFEAVSFCPATQTSLSILIATSGRLSDTYGGGQVYVRNLVAELRRRGHKVTVLAHVAWSRTASEGEWQVPVNGVRWRRMDADGLEAYEMQFAGATLARDIADELSRAV